LKNDSYREHEKAVPAAAPALPAASRSHTLV
jgi:hypothetical protein